MAAAAVGIGPAASAVNSCRDVVAAIGRSRAIISSWGKRGWRTGRHAAPFTPAGRREGEHHRQLQQHPKVRGCVRVEFEKPRRNRRPAAGRRPQATRPAPGEMRPSPAKTAAVPPQPRLDWQAGRLAIQAPAGWAGFASYRGSRLVMECFSGGEANSKGQTERAVISPLRTGASTAGQTHARQLFAAFAPASVHFVLRLRHFFRRLGRKARWHPAAPWLPPS